MTNRKRAIWAALGLCMPFLALAAFLGWLEVSGNFGTVLPGMVYRSSQPTPERLETYVNDHGIKTVLNLRGAAPGEPWYEAERQAAEKLGLTMVDFPLASTRELTPDEETTLLQILRDATPPLLIYCRSGANRTGLAAAAYLAFVAGQPPQVASRQISLRYGHLAVPFRPETSAMDRSWISMQGLLADQP